MNTVVRMDVQADPNQARAERVAQRHAELLATDAQYRDAMPLESVGELKKNFALRSSQLMQAVMEAYADRPAVGRRAHRIVRDAASGRRSLQLVDRFDTLTYSELWAEVRGLASLWQHDDNLRVRSGDLVAILGFGSVGFLMTDLACLHSGAVTVPLQTNAPMTTLQSIVKEAEPRCVAASIEALDEAVEMIVGGYSPASLLVLDYCADDDEQRERFDRAAAKLAAADVKVRLLALEEACALGKALPAPTLHVPAATEDPLATIYYTSGSTGSPKGAMLGERMYGIAWRAPDARPLIVLNYMPMNHSFGRILSLRTLAAGGTCYFTAKTDLSTLFDDIQLVRPTFINFVTRICEMVYQRYQAELATRPSGTEPADVEADIRNRHFGGRLVNAAFGAAPMTAELWEFIERSLDVSLPNGYGATEIMGVTMNNKVMRPPVIDWKLVDVPELGYFLTDKPHPRGELLVKTHTIMQGYYKNPKATASVFTDDGYYKTGDVMAQTGPDELIYVDRRNNVQKLAQGEFVAIAQLETTFTNGHPLIYQAFLYGTAERAFLLGVFVPDRDAMARAGIDVSDAVAVKAGLREAIQSVAQAEHLQSYEVPRDFIVEMQPFTAENGLLTGVGKPKRPSLKELYGSRLEAMYGEIAAKQAGELDQLRAEGRNAPVIETLVRAVQATLGTEAVDPDAPVSFEDLGGDSLSALSLSMLLEEIYDVEVPVGVITHPAGSLRRLAAYIEESRRAEDARPTVTSVHGKDATQVHARDLTLEKFIDATTLERAATLPPPSQDAPRTVLVTGANGYLGRFLMLEWLERLAPVGGTVVCIVRGRDAAEARRRIDEAIDTGDAELSRRFRALAEHHLQVLAGDLSERHLGLDHENWERLTQTVDLIVHPAALVNHVLPYQQLFGPNVVGTAELLRLALTSKLKRFVNVSTVAVAFVPGVAPLDEDADVRVAGATRAAKGDGYAAGYAVSKWAGEVLLREAHDRFRLPISNFRSDMILAHRRWQGQLNVPDMFTRWVYSIVKTGLAPQSFYKASGNVRPHYDGLPSDFTAASIVALGERATQGFQTYHVVNPHEDGISMDDFVDWIVEAGYPVQRVADYGDWLGRFETTLKALPDRERQQSFLPLLHQLREPMPASAGAHVASTRFHSAVRTIGVGAESDIPHLSRELIQKYVSDLKTVGLL